MALHSVKPAVFFVIILLLTVGCYWPGLSGGFLFDDFPNLEGLGAYGGVVNYETFKSFVLTGWSGPFGRPISLLSFLLDDNTWPSYAPWFKQTNLLIHLLVGLMLCWSALLLLRLYGYAEKKAVWIAVLTASFWLLHPYFVSTTLYVVQRMAQLAALFMLAGLAGYLHGRLLLATRPLKAYLWMTISLGLGTLLAVFSKENGALLPLLLLVVEFCRPSASAEPGPRLWWSATFLWVPSLAVLGALASFIDFSPNPWPIRTFNQPERLLSEGRIVWEYLFHLWVPRIEGRGLFHDGYQISTGLFSPPITALAVIGLMALAAFAVTQRKRWPLLSVAVLFFFVGHLVESTVIGLELYFEHRNYVAAAFLFLPLAAGCVSLAERYKPALAGCVVALILMLLAGMTWQRAALWSDSKKLELYWAVATPESARAQSSLAAYLFENNRVEESMLRLEEASRNIPNNGLLVMRLLLQKVYVGQASEADFDRAVDSLRDKPLDPQVVMALRTLIDVVIGPRGSPAYISMAHQLLGEIGRNKKFRHLPLFVRLVPYLEGRLFLAQDRPAEAHEAFKRAMQLYGSVEAGFMMVAETASKGHYAMALEMLDQVEVVLERQEEKTLTRGRKTYEYEIARLQGLLRQELSSGSK